MKLLTLIVIFGNLFCSVLSLKCYVCSSTEDCRKPRLTECNSDIAKSTAEQFSFLPRAQSQASSDKYNCASYRGTFANSSTIEMAGCFYNTYNPCEEINHLVAQKWVCRYCDSRDGCNPASRAISSGSAIFLLIAFPALMFERYL